MNMHANLTIACTSIYGFKIYVDGDGQILQAVSSVFLNDAAVWYTIFNIKGRVNLNPGHVKEQINGGSTDYIPIDTETKDIREPEEMDTSDANEVNYRSIETPKKPEDIQEEVDEDTVGESFDEYIKRRTIELNRQLDEVHYKNAMLPSFKLALC